MLHTGNLVRAVLHSNLAFLYPPRFDKSHGPEGDAPGVGVAPAPAVSELSGSTRAGPGFESDEFSETGVDALGAEPEEGTEDGKRDESAGVEGEEGKVEGDGGTELGEMSSQGERVDKGERGPYVFRQSISLSRINSLESHSPLLGQPGLDPFLVGTFILQRNDRRHALPFALAWCDAEAALKGGGDEELVEEANLVALCDVVWCRGDRSKGCGRDGVKEIFVSERILILVNARMKRKSDSLFPLDELGKFILVCKSDEKPHFLALFALGDPRARRHPQSGIPQLINQSRITFLDFPRGFGSALLVRAFGKSVEVRVVDYDEKRSKGIGRLGRLLKLLHRLGDWGLCGLSSRRRRRRARSGRSRCNGRSEHVVMDDSCGRKGGLLCSIEPGGSTWGVHDGDGFEGGGSKGNGAV